MKNCFNKRASHIGLILTVMLSICFTGGYADNSNAAFAYIKAWESYTEVPAVTRTLMKQIIQNGWTNPQPAIEELLEKNRYCLSILRKATGMKHCDFAATVPGQHPPEAHLPFSLSHMIKASELLAAAGMEREKNSDFRGAADDYLSILKLARHYVSYPHIITSAGAIGTEKYAATLLERLTRHPKITRKQKKKIHGFLQHYLQNRFTFEYIVNNEKESFLHSLPGTIKDCRKLLVRLKISKITFSPIEKKIRAQFHKSADYYYGLIIKASKENSPASWQAVAQASARMAPANKNNYRGPAVAIVSEFKKNRGSVGNDAVTRAVDGWLVTLLFNAKPIFANWLKSRDHLRTVLQLTK